MVSNPRVLGGVRWVQQNLIHVVTIVASYQMTSADAVLSLTTISSTLLKRDVPTLYHFVHNLIKKTRNEIFSNLKMLFLCWTENGL